MTVFTAIFDRRASGANHEGTDPARVANILRTTLHHPTETYICDDARSSIAVAGWVTLDNLRPLRQRQQLPVTASSIEVVASGLRQHGINFVEQLRGAFVFVVHDREQRRAIAVRDQIGLRPLWYWFDADRLIISPSTQPLQHIDGVAPQASRYWMASHLLGLGPAVEQRPWTNVHEVPPASVMSWRLDDVSSPRFDRYFQFSAENEPVADNDEPWIGAYRARLHDATYAKQSDRARLAVEASGGIDSGTLLALAALHRQDAPGSLLSIGYEMFDREPEFARLTSTALGVAHRALPDRGHVTADEIRRAVRALGHPPEHPTVDGHISLLSAAATLGVDSLQSGFGGDEAVTNRATIAVVELLRRRPTSLAALSDGGPITRLARTGRSIAQLSGFTRTQWQIRGHIAELLGQTSVRPDVLADYGLDVVFAQARIGSTSHTNLNASVIARLQEPFVARRTSQGALIAHEHGIEYQWPLLDIDLIAQWLATPTNLKLRSGTGRYLHRRSVEGMLPDKVLWNPSKHMGNLIRPTKTSHLREATQLRADLHPMLAEVLDIGQHVKQAQAIDAAPTRTVGPRWSVHRRTASAAQAINIWLHEFAR